MTTTFGDADHSGAEAQPDPMNDGAEACYGVPVGRSFP